jgi:hypothetical protein
MVFKDKKEKWHLILLLLIVFSIVSFSLVFFQYELHINGYEMGTAGSDMSIYYDAQLKMFEEGNYLEELFSNRHAVGYIVWGAMIQSLSFNESVIWIKICNILIFLHLLLALYILLSKRFSYKASFLMTSFISLDGILIWAAIRNLRDIIIMYLMVESILIMENLYEKRKFDFKSIALLLLTVFVLGRFRLFGIFYVFVIIGIYLYKIVKSKTLFVAGFVTSLLIGIFLYNLFFVNDVSAYRLRYINQYVVKNNQRVELAGILQQGSPLQRFVLGGIRYVFLPSPMSLLSVTLSPDIQVYEPTSYIGFTGRFWLLESSFLWWLLLPLCFFALLNKKYRGNTVMLSLGVIVILYIAMYGYIFGGATGSRQRIPLHITGIIYAIANFSSTDPKKIMSFYPLIAIPLFISSYLWALMIQ